MADLTPIPMGIPWEPSLPHSHAHNFLIAPEPAPLPGIARCRSVKMLGVVIAEDDFSVTQHVQRLVTSSAQTNYALRVLRCHGLNNAALQHVYIGLPRYRRRSSDVRRQRLARFHQGV